MTDYPSQLEALRQKFTSDVEALADQYRKEVLIPLCCKHKLTFTSGMGTFFFSKGKVNVGSVPVSGDEERLYQRLNLKPILDILDLEVEGNQVFGYYVGDIRKGDIR